MSFDNQVVNWHDGRSVRVRAIDVAALPCHRVLRVRAGALCARRARAVRTLAVAATNGSSAAPRTEADDDIQVGDLVVIMAEPGPFTVVEVEPPYVTIKSPAGVRRKVRDIAVRRVSGEPPVPR